MTLYNLRPYDLNQAPEFKDSLDYIKDVSYVKCQDEVPGASDCMDGEHINFLTSGVNN
jgi:hypothetical protein